MQRQGVVVARQRHERRIALAHVDRLVELEDLGGLFLLDRAALPEQVDDRQGAAVEARELRAIDLDLEVVDAVAAASRQEVLDRLDLDTPAQ